MGYAYQLIIRVLSDNFGIFIFDNGQEDFSINDYICDSITFIQFVLTIEEEIGRELPDDFLNMEILDSAKGFAEMLDAYIESV